MSDNAAMPSPKKEDKKVDSVEDRARRVVDAWSAANILNSAMSRHTESYNHLVQSLPDLVGRLTEEFKA